MDSVTDLTERLRERNGYNDELLEEAAATLETLTQENARLREALEKAADEFTMVIYRLDNGEPERALGAAQCGGRGSRKALGGGDES